MKHSRNRLTFERVYQWTCADGRWGLGCGREWGVHVGNIFEYSDVLTVEQMLDTMGAILCKTDSAPAC